MPTSTIEPSGSSSGVIPNIVPVLAILVQVKPRSVLLLMPLSFTSGQ